MTRLYIFLYRIRRSIREYIARKIVAYLMPELLPLIRQQAQLAIDRKIIMTLVEGRQSNDTVRHGHNR